jgi:hypothetical protein
METAAGRRYVTSRVRPELRIAAAEGRSAVSRPAGSTGKKKYTHTASPHEFGHMIGLSDEYLEDLNMAGLSKVDPARLQINDRIMNVGERVTADAYAPFADWLSFVTGTSWKVGKSLR